MVAEDRVESLLLKAASKGDVDDVARCVQAGAAVNYKNQMGMSALHLAATHGHVPVVKWLISHNADPNITDRRSQTPCHHLAYLANEKFTQAHLEITSHLISRGAKINLLDKYNRSPLHYAAQHGTKDLVELLLNRNADPELGHKHRRPTPIHLARSNGHEDVWLILVTKTMNRKRPPDEDLPSRSR